MANLCRDCMATNCPNKRCPNCGSPRILNHPELFSLSIAHLDCDAFYASIEKRENPDLADKPLIIGGGRRGVVSTACYIARIRGVRSAMPMFQALKICPDAVILKPRMSLYAKVSKDIRQMMGELTPSIEPLSLDEAFIDLTGTSKLHNASPAVVLAKLANRIHRELGLTGSIGLSHNKFLAKIASDLDKPRGFSIIGKAETNSFLEDKPIRLIWGIGKKMQMLLEESGIRTFRDLTRWDRKDLNYKFGQIGDRLWYLGRGEDTRSVESHVSIKSVSNEITFLEDTSASDLLDGHLWRMCEKVSSRMKAKSLVGRVASLKLKTSIHKIITKRTTLREPTQLADTMYDALSNLMEKMEPGQTYRLLGASISDLCSVKEADMCGDLLDTNALKRGKAERASDSIREKFGPDAIIKGRALR
ncbi:MAG: DNA polymerase IV [Rhodobacteraceae bacterium]|nr:DNA polymerase IV [Paracoccaceae bacterium]